MSNDLKSAAVDFEAEMNKLIRPISRDGSAKPQPVDTVALLSEREKTHGDFSDHARATQKIKAILYEYYSTKHPTIHRESLEMIAHKLGRILAGDPDFRDHWDDIAGYAKLVADRCSK